jgi:transcriptional regulator with XRE-family HTH domain
MLTGYDLKEKRLLMGLSQVSLAGLMYVTPTTISIWERGGRDHTLRRKHEIRLVEVTQIYENKMRDSASRVKGYTPMTAEQWASRKAEKLRLLRIMAAETPSDARERSAMARAARDTGQPYDPTHILPDDVPSPVAPAVDPLFAPDNPFAESNREFQRLYGGSK